MDSALSLHRLHFAFTITYHYIFPQLTMGLAPLIVILKSLALRTGDERYNQAARFWAKIFAVNFLFGVITGVDALLPVTRCLRLFACLRFQRSNLSLAARRQHGDFAAALIGNNDTQRLTVSFEQRDVARLDATRRQIEQCPLLRARIVLGDFVRAP